jgi:hypothetical protein
MFRGRKYIKWKHKTSLETALLLPNLKYHIASNLNVPNYILNLARCSILGLFNLCNYNLPVGFVWPVGVSFPSP